MYRQEILHNSTNNIYLWEGTFEILNGSEEMFDFQNSIDPTLLGYLFVESLQERLDRLNED
jgi:hypothetical protein